MYEDVVMIPDIKMKKMWFYKFNNKTKTLKKIIGGSSEITEIQEYLMEKGLIKKDKIVLTNVGDYGFKYKYKFKENKDAEEKDRKWRNIWIFRYHSRTNKIDFRFFDKKILKKKQKQENKFKKCIKRKSMWSRNKKTRIFWYD